MSVCFQNKGEIDVRGLFTFGASAKINETAIGYFGTGLKYALAVLLREGCEVDVYSGTRRIEITSKPVMMRDVEFNMVHFNGKEASFTVDLGKNWELWMAYRELRANAMDEEDWHVGRNLAARVGYTTIVVRGNKFASLHDQQDGDGVFLSTEPTWILGDLEAHPSATQSKWLYCNGIRAFKLDKPAMYNYNVTSKLTLTEDRTIASMPAFFRVYAKAMGECDYPSLIRQVLEADQRYFESTIDYHWWNYQPGEVFNKIVSTYISSGTSCNCSARSKYREKNPQEEAPGAVQWESIPIVNRRKLWAAVRFWQKLGFNITREDIIVTDQLKKIRGKALRKKVYLSLFVLDGDMRTVTGLVYKYWSMTKPKVGDVKSEDLLIDTVVDFGERILRLT